MCVDTLHRKVTVKMTILALPELQLILWSVAAVDTTMITLMCEYSKR